LLYSPAGAMYMRTGTAGRDFASVAAGGAEPAVPVWYACYTRARHEKRVQALLEERGFEVYLPLIDRVRQWKDRRKTVHWPLFPSYVFSRFDIRDAHRVLAVPGVSWLVKSNGRAAPIAAEELQNVRRFVNALKTAGLEPEPRPFLAKGDWVEVMGGALKGVRGVIVESRGRRRVVIGLQVIGQGLEVDINTDLLRRLPPPQHGVEGV
jgi:transcriptional antiterminator RfaH